jgi:capsule polysaccharide export protein KpsE/RkpR
MNPPSGIEDAVRQLPDIDSPETKRPGNNGFHDVRESVNFDWAWLLWSKRALLWRFTWRGFLVAIVIALLIPKRYESTARLMPAENNSGSGLAMMAAMAGGTGGSSLGASALSGLASGLLGTHDPGAVWSDMLRSRTVEDRIIEKFDLREVYGVSYLDDARKNLDKSTQIDIDRKSGVITIGVTDRDKKRAQDMTQAYIDELDRTVALVSTSAARRERVFLEQRLHQVKHDLDQVSSQFADYASKNTVIDVDAQTRAMVGSAAALQGQLIAAQSELEGLEQIYTPNNVRVKMLQARVAELRSQLQKMGGVNGVDASSPAQPADSDQLYPSIRKLPLLGVRWIDLYRETKIQQTVYELLTEQFELAKIEEAKEIPTVKVLDPPNWPERKSSPPRMLIVLLGALLSFGSCTVWVLGMATWEQMDPADPRKQLAHEVASRSRISWSGWVQKISRLRRGELRSNNLD